MRIGGLASGMDTDQMIKDMMKAENIKVDRVKADKQIAEWQKETLNDLNKDFANFVVDSKKGFGYNNLGRPGDMNWIKSATSSDDTVATVRSKSGVPDGTHNIEVKNLAEGVKGGSLKPIDSSKTFKDLLGLAIGTEGTEDETMSIEINGAKITVSASDNIEGFVKTINNAKVAMKDDAGVVIKDSDGNAIMTGIGVKASYDPYTKRFFIASEKTGAKDGEINFKTDDANAVKFINETLDLQLSSDVDGEYKSREVVLVESNLTDPTNLGQSFKGIDSTIEYNGIKLSQSSNNFEVNGMSVNIKTVGKINVSISTDIDTMVEKVKEFVDNYNLMLEKAANLMSEKKNRDFRPLSDEQREAMSDKEVELWDAKAKSGVINGDADVQRMLSSMRSSLYMPVAGDHGEVRYKDKNGIERTGALNSITQIGITTQQYKSGSAGGQLTLDEDKLREVLSYNPEGVKSILFSEDKELAIKDDDKLSIEDRSKKRGNSGLVTRVFDELVIGMKTIIGKAGAGGSDNIFKDVKRTIMVDFVTKGGRYSGAGNVSDIDSDMAKFNKKIEDLNRYLSKKESMYYAQFTAMEKAMQRTASQSGWLQQQM